MPQQSTGPFFSNDIAGMVKVALTFGGSLLIFSAIVVKWGQSMFSKRLEKLETDLNNLGTNVNSIKLDCTGSTAKHGELKERFDRKEVIVDGLLKDLGQTEALVRSVEKQEEGLQRELMEFMLAALKDRDIKIEAMGKDIARLQERENTRQIVREMLLNTREQDSRGKA